MLCLKVGKCCSGLLLALLLEAVKSALAYLGVGRALLPDVHLLKFVLALLCNFAGASDARCYALSCCFAVQSTTILYFIAFAYLGGGRTLLFCYSLQRARCGFTFRVGLQYLGGDRTERDGLLFSLVEVECRNSCCLLSCCCSLTFPILTSSTYDVRLPAAGRWWAPIHRTPHQTMCK